MTTRRFTRRVGRSDERGAVTVETAMALPMLALFTLSMAWLVSIGLTQVRAVDGAREAARAAARDDSMATARALGARVAAEGSRITIDRRDGTVVARVSSPVGGPAGLFGDWVGFEVHAEAVAAEEPTG